MSNAVFGGVVAIVRPSGGLPGLDFAIAGNAARGIAAGIIAPRGRGARLAGRFGEERCGYRLASWDGRGITCSCRMPAERAGLTFSVQALSMDGMAIMGAASRSVHRADPFRC